MNVCRLCLQHSKEEHFPVSNENDRTREKMQECVPEMEDVHLWKAKMCAGCLDKLNTAYEFRTRCLSSLQIIKDIVAQGQHSADNIDDYFLSFKCKQEKGVVVISDDEEDKVKKEPIEDTNPALDEPHVEHVFASDYNSNVGNTVDLPNDYPMIEDLPTNEYAYYEINPTSIKGRQRRTSGYYLNYSPEASFTEQSPNYQINSAPKYYFNTKQEPQKHKLNATVSTERAVKETRKYMCQICFRQYTNKACLHKHLQKAHTICKKSPHHIYKSKRFKQVMKSISEDDLSQIKMELTAPCSMTICYSCNITLGCLHELKYHNSIYHYQLPVENVHFTVFCNKCKLRLSHKYINEHLESHKYVVELEDIFKEVQVPHEGTFIIVKFWKCDICDVVFNSSKESLDHHYDQHRELMS